MKMLDVSMVASGVLHLGIFWTTLVITISCSKNVYRVILYRHYGVALSSMWLCHIHPTYDSYHLIKVPDLLQQAGMILDEYALGRTELMPWELQLPCKSFSGGMPGAKKPRLN